MKINWTVRIKNKLFWIALIPAALLLVRQVLALFGVEFDTSALAAALTEIVETAFLILTLLGIVVDPTTSGMSDSEQALTYDRPKE